jgi:Txe/YoeB family toxin of Txe-Axe toxin-antitoxin module
MLEFNLYNNFNPNKASDFIVKARGIAMNYELWQTGYKYTSTATLSIKAEIGDIVEILIDDSYTLATAASTVEKFDLNLLYIVTDIDDSNKATLKNYFWAMIDGVEVPTNILNGSSLSVLNTITNPKIVGLINNGLITNQNELAQQVKYNRKSDTDTAEKIAQDMLRVIKRQPFVIIKNNEIKTVLAARAWDRQTISTMISGVHNPSIEFETIIQRSNYNFLNAYTKKEDETYPQQPECYTIDDSNNVINLSSYIGDGSDLPSQRLIKTSFFDEQPTIAEIKALITKDTTVANIFFNQNELMQLVTNDLADLYYQGQLYQGYIADRGYFESDGGLRNERLLFIEGGNK